MAVIRSKDTKQATRQLTLTGKPAPVTSESSSQKSTKSDRVLTDALFAIKPEFTELIAKREKNHEYRVYKLKDTVVRIWLYTTAPVGAITHVMETTLPKTPGEVCDPSGIGNDDFDQGLKKSKFGYPVVGLYRLKTPLTPDAMKTFGAATPQGYMYVPKKMFDGIPLDSEDIAEKLF